eukprot:TRINITY_DN1579_c0_g1_i2.p1 TRINITY_DN1579_c0_g1~~TRINITY_DN1579_c0_g1_i2.p1  ORF type:complete len:389 (+),score=39.40 TRINITY_DN1579_c0_g1_i2:77-1243(+)
MDQIKLQNLQILYDSQLLTLEDFETIKKHSLQESMITLEDIPNEIFYLEIFPLIKLRQLFRMGLVSKRWRALFIYTLQNATAIDFSTCAMVISHILPQVLSKSKSLQRASFQSCYRLNDRDMNLFISHPSSSQVNHLELIGCNQIKASLHSLHSSNIKNNLNHLNLEKCAGISDLQFLNDLPNLTYLNLSSMKLTGPKMNAYNPTSKPKLHTLIISSTRMIESAVEPFFSTLLEMNVDTLETLSLLSTDHLNTFKDTLPKCVNLTSLDISWQENADEILSSIAGKCCKLQVLLANSCFELKTETLSTLVTQSPQLKWLEIARSCYKSKIENSRKLIEDIMLTCHNLKVFNVTGSGIEVDGDGLSQLIQSRKGSKNYDPITVLFDSKNT